MTHLLNIQNDITDVSNNGYYHNIKFKETAELRGLEIEKDNKYGWTITELKPETKEWVDKNLGGADINASRLPEIASTEGGKRKSVNRSIKYVCPECGTIIRATRQVNVVCGDCDVPFEQQ